ncbi:hypothetical protein P167DRAFT_547749 [Morchella conica CCBAS932]|uniref:4Fe-4S ferredoxin-type domain-containing protein n=1 Tax=Morchella conica CCBAS932 TaxID=1392247 RepID=A0A3N4KH36_9PEZI|nr:hypothetical protein P167DRAFT_547749 [Morchella conica CCBAS932]
MWPLALVGRVAIGLYVASPIIGGFGSCGTCGACGSCGTTVAAGPVGRTRLQHNLEMGVYFGSQMYVPGPGNPRSDSGLGSALAPLASALPRFTPHCVPLGRGALGRLSSHCNKDLQKGPSHKGHKHWQYLPVCLGYPLRETSVVYPAHLRVWRSSEGHIRPVGMAGEDNEDSPRE